MSTCLASFKPGLVLNDTWVLGELLGEGACGKVFRVGLLPTDNKPEPLDLVIKAAYLPKGKSAKIKEQIRSASTIFKEYQMHKGPLLGFKYLPGLPTKHRPVGEDHSHSYMVMQRLDYSLEELAMAGTPSLQSISSLGLLILDGLRDMHRRGYVFVDVKPENFMVLRGPRAAGTTSRGADKDFLPGDQIFFTDFGLMEKLRSYNGGGGQRENETRATLAGNACFCSLDVHACAVPAAKDDVEAVGYMLLSLLDGGRLPWSTGRSAEECLRLKRDADLQQLAARLGCPPMAEFIDQTRQLQYEEAPNYDRLQALLQSLPACSKGGRRSTGKGTSGRTSSSSSAVSSSTSTSSGARQSLLAGDNKGAAAEKKETAAQKKAAAVFADTTKKQVVPAARSTRGRSVHEEEEEEIPSANVKKPRVAGTAKTVSRPAAAVAKSVSKPARGSEGARARAKAEEVITISSDEEESQEEDTPVKAKKPQPAAPSTTSGTKRTRGGTRVSGSTRASQHVPEPLEEDSDEGEARGNTPVKAKKSAAPPPTAVRSPAPALQPPSPLVRASSKARAAPSPLLHRDTTVPIPLQAATGERRGDKKDGGGAQKLYLQVKTSDCAAYVDRMWPVGGMGGAGGVQVVGSDAEKAGIRDITLEDDHFLSARHAMLQVNAPQKPRTSASTGRGGSRSRTSGEGAQGISVQLKDLHSTNGTRVNGEAISPDRWTSVQLGDVIQLGKTEVVLRMM